MCVAGCSMPVKVKEHPTVGLFSSSPVGPRDLTQVVGLGKCIYLQTHLMRTLSFFFFFFLDYSENCRAWVEGQDQAGPVSLKNSSVIHR